MDEERLKILKWAILAIVLIFSFITINDIHSNYTGLVFEPHTEPQYKIMENRNYPFPIHTDEWHHLAKAIFTIETQELPLVNPYSPELDEHTNHEIGYSIFLSGFFVLTGLDPVLNYQHLAALFFVVNAILLFLFMKRFAKSFWIGIFAILFFLATPSNINLLGNWFALPLTFSIFMIFGFLILIDKFLEESKRKHLVLASVVFLVMALTYPFAVILSAFILIPYLFIQTKIQEREIIKNNLKKIIPAGIILLAIGLFIFLEYFVEHFIFDRSWTFFQFDYDLVFFYGLLPTALALIGALFVWKKGLNKVFLIWPALTLINIGIIFVTDKALFIAYERTMYYYFLGVAMLAGIGLYYILLFIKDKLQEAIGNNGFREELSLIAIAIIAFFVFGQLFVNYQEIEDREVVLLYLLEEPDYDALKFIENNYGKGNTILADRLISVGVYPISQNQIVAMIGGNLWYGDIQIPLNFFTSDLGCEFKENIIRDEEVDLVLSVAQIECDFLRLVYDDFDFVYEVI